ncbi:hypothetical protein AB0G15_29035 [Streptosporangium sp. NPDC023825]|uniref:hypothetical protein n=1 Tax=Streptosporangium sp. NPDC023825 TaxID=3154909 RepID=UPI0034379759
MTGERPEDGRKTAVEVIWRVEVIGRQPFNGRRDDVLPPMFYRRGAISRLNGKWRQAIPRETIPEA